MRKSFTTYNEAHGRHEMLPGQLRAIRLDMGINMIAMAHLLEAHTTSRISRGKYREWEKPRKPDQWPYIPRHIAEEVERLYSSFYDFVDTLVAMWDGTSPLVLIHRNDMFEQAKLPLPYGITVDNYNQAVGKAWGRILEQGHLAELAYFTTDPDNENLPPGVQVPGEKLQEQTPEIVGELPEVRRLDSFVRMSWDNGREGLSG